MQYDWYEIVGMSVLVGVVVFIVFRGLDLALERLLEALATRRDRKLAAEDRAAWLAERSVPMHERLRLMSEAATRVADSMAKAFPKQDKGDRG